MAKFQKKPGMGDQQQGQQPGSFGQQQGPYEEGQKPGSYYEAQQDSFGQPTGSTGSSGSGPYEGQGSGPYEGQQQGQRGRTRTETYRETETTGQPRVGQPEGPYTEQHRGVEGQGPYQGQQQETYEQQRSYEQQRPYEGQQQQGNYQQGNYQQERRYEERQQRPYAEQHQQTHYERPHEEHKPKSHKKWLWLALLGLIALGLIIAAASGAFSSSTNHAAARDVHLTRCATNGNPDVMAQITNHSGQPSNYVMAATMRNAAGNKVGEAIGTSASVAPGQTATTHLAGTAHGNVASCTLDRVTRHRALP